MERIGAVFPRGNLVDDLPSYFQLALAGIFFLAIIFVMIGGIQYVTAGGDDGKAKAARKTIINALIGLVISSLAFALVEGVKSIIYGGAGSNFLR